MPSEPIGKRLHKIEFKALVEKFSRLVLNVALRILGNNDLARDVHQEVFLAVWRRWDFFQGDTKWRAYLYRTTVRKAIEIAKQPAITISINESESNCLASPERPDKAFMTKEFYQNLKERLIHLPERQADVFILSRIEGLNYKEIAEVLCCSEPTVRVHLHRALKQLSRELKEFL